MLALIFTAVFAQASDGKWDWKHVAAIDDVRVDIRWAAVTPVSYLRVEGTTHLDRENKFIVVLQMETASQTKKRDYDRWHSSVVDEKNATLVDEHGNKYRQINPLSNLRIKGRLGDNASIYPKKPIFDVLLFEPPIETAKMLRLSLPAKNVGLAGSFTFDIPLAKIPQGKPGEHLDSGYFFSRNPPEEKPIPDKKREKKKSIDDNRKGI